MGLVRRNIVVLLSGAAMTVLASAPQVAAQSQNQNTKNITLLERLVIGAGAPKVAIDTPQAVTVVDQADLDREQPTTVKEMVDSVPGVAVIGSDRVLGESFNIRGIGTAENSGDESRIIVNVDGAKKFYEQYRMGSFFSDPELYKQVEVLRGPASSTLYGSGALGGVINFTTKEASDFIKEGMTGAVRIKGQYSSNGSETLTSGLIAHKFNDTFDILATGNWRRSNDFELANGSTLSGSAFDAKSGLIKGTARFGDNDEQLLSLSYQKWLSNAADQDYAQTGTTSLFGTVDRDVTDQTAVLHYENPDSDNPWVDLKANLSFSDTYVKQTGATLGAPFSNAEYGYKTWQASLENTSEFTGENWDNFLTYGAQFTYQDRTAFTTMALPSPAISTHPEGNDTRLGLYAQDEFVLDDRLTIITGLRSDFVWQKPELYTVGRHDINDIALSPKIAALYDINDNFSVFGSVAHTERLPTLDELYQYESGRTPSLDLKKERSNSYEAGFAISGYELIQDGDQAAVKVTGFYNDLTDLIEASPRNSGLPYFRNVGSATIYGIEIEGDYESEYFFGRLAYSASIGKNNVTGADLTSIPGHKLVLTLGARAPEYDLEYGIKGTLVAATPTGVAPANDMTGTPKGEPAYATFDLFSSWKPQTGPLAGTEAQFSIENVFNADYRDNQNPDRSKGRTFKLTLAKQFDY